MPSYSDKLPERLDKAAIEWAAVIRLNAAEAVPPLRGPRFIFSAYCAI